MIQDVNMDGFVKAKDYQSESDEFIVPPHFRIFKSLGEEKCASQIHMVSNKSVAAEQYRMLNPKVVASNG